MAIKKGVKPIAQNKKARHDYFIHESIECGIELKGTEVKSMRQGRVNLKESFAQVKDGEIFVQGMHISPYEQGNIFNTDPLRPKRLLLHKSEIRKKLTLGLCQGKHAHDKRASTAERDVKRDLARRVRTNSRGDGD